MIYYYFAVLFQLLIKQDELEECQTKLSNKTRDMETEEALRKRLEKELTQTSEKAVYLEAEWSVNTIAKSIVADVVWSILNVFCLLQTK